MGKWRSIKDAPLDGTAVKIKGKRFLSRATFQAVAVYARRRCPALCEGWFPPKVDRMGPYNEPTHWQPLH